MKSTNPSVINTIRRLAKHNSTRYAYGIKFMVGKYELETDVWYTHINDANLLANDICRCNRYKDIEIGRDEEKGEVYYETIRVPNFIVTSELLHEVRNKAIAYFLERGYMKKEDTEFPRDTYEITIWLDKQTPIIRWIPKETLYVNAELLAYVNNALFMQRKIGLNEIYSIRKKAKKLS